MPGFFRQKRTVEQLDKELMPAIHSNDDKTTAALFEELIAHLDKEPEKAEELLGQGIAAAGELLFPCATHYLPWFMEHFPHSVMPVKAQYAIIQSRVEQNDNATENAREYLRLIKDKGIMLSPNLCSQNGSIIAGCFQSFMTLTRSYWHAGALSYCKRIMKYASTLHLESHHLEKYQYQIEDIDKELQIEENQHIDQLWEEFFQCGKNVTELNKLCQEKDLPKLATRVELLGEQFRLNKDFHIDENEMFLIVQKSVSPDEQSQRILA